MWLFFACDPGQIRYVHVWNINICFEIAIAYTPQIKFLATPLEIKNHMRGG